jgi:hypothetical protein
VRYDLIRLQNVRLDLGDDGGLLAAREGGELGRLQRQLDERRQRHLRIRAVRRRVRLVLLDVQPHRGAGGARAGQPEDEPRAVGEHEADALRSRRFKRAW